MHAEQVKLLNSYLNDIAKYASPLEPVKARACFMSLPRQLAKNGVSLRYWMNESGSREIEFLGLCGGAVEQIEVKASRGATVSLDDMLARDEIRCGYKLIDGNVGRLGKKITLPLYMAMFLYR